MKSLWGWLLLFDIDWGIMTATMSLRERAEQYVTTVHGAIADQPNGQVIGSINDLHRDLSLDCNRNELRVALALLCARGRLIGTPLDSISIGLPAKKYLYRIGTNPERALLYRLKSGRLEKSGSAADYLFALGIDDVSAEAFDIVIKGLVEDGVIVAPYAIRASNTSKLSMDVYLYLKLSTKE